MAGSIALRLLIMLALVLIVTVRLVGTPLALSIGLVREPITRIVLQSSGQSSPDD